MFEEKVKLTCDIMKVLKLTWTQVTKIWNSTHEIPKITAKIYNFEADLLHPNMV